MDILLSNFCPICQNKIRYAHVLGIGEPLPRWKIVCESGAWVHIKSDKDGLDHVIYMKLAALPKSKKEISEQWHYVDNQNVISKDTVNL